ncbi:MAG: hypothetical protein VKQ33_09665 [Candidatus Sericytochromatia bacterium]|nr:hypothetical protein [Candidatus Sericytochromatia bacterium]
MSQTVKKRRPKAEVLQELDALLGRGEALRDRPIEDALELARACVEKLVWRQEVLALLPHMTRGISAAAAFNRPGLQADAGPREGLDEELRLHQEGLHAQLEALREAAERWRRSGTRPLA